MASVGYELVRTTLGLSAPAPWRAARVRPVTRIVATEGELQVPASVAPHSGRPLEHLLFALKHEGVDLQILAQALPHVTAEEVLEAVAGAPTSRYVRTLGYLWETLTGRRLAEAPAVRGNYVDLFDPAGYAELLAFANASPAEADPLVCAAVISFGFVFIHPFMDGNGRLSRFLFHKALFDRGELSEGRLLPISVAMKRHERDYLATLQATSAPLRERWRVRFVDEGRYDFEFTGDAALYRYWDATRAAEFSLRMAQQALEIDLQQETRYLARYDAVKRAVEARFDVRNNTLATLVHGALQNDNVVSRNRRKQFEGQVSGEVFELIERAARDSE